MAVRIRMTRIGRKDRACFRLGAYDSRTPRDGRCLEVLGYYEPGVADAEKQLEVKGERVKHWLSTGALPTVKVAALLKRKGLATGAAGKTRKKKSKKAKAGA